MKDHDPEGARRPLPVKFHRKSGKCQPTYVIQAGKKRAKIWSGPFRSQGGGLSAGAGIPLLGAMNASTRPLPTSPFFLQTAVLDASSGESDRLDGHYDFRTLNLTPDETQFRAALGMTVPPPSEHPEPAPPDLVTAMRDQLGLKLTVPKSRLRIVIDKLSNRRRTDRPALPADPLPPESPSPPTPLCHASLRPC